MVADFRTGRWSVSSPTAGAQIGVPGRRAGRPDVRLEGVSAGQLAGLKPPPFAKRVGDPGAVYRPRLFQAGFPQELWRTPRRGGVM